MAKVVKILSIDGGGIRGIIPAIILDRIEKLTRQPVSKLFDLIAGTSTGGILTLGLTKPDAAGAPHFSAGAVADVYRNKGARIFSRSLWHRVMALDNLVDEKFQTDGIEAVLSECFGESRLKDAVTDVLVTSFEIEKSFPFFFKSSAARRQPDYDFAMRDVARATSAAPTYFEPCKLSAGNGTSDYYALVDGGVYANNPAACALVEAIATHRDATDFVVVSLGTGATSRSVRYEDAKNWGVAGWAKPVLDIVFDGVSSTVDYQLQQLMPTAANGVPSYFRLQTTLLPNHSSFDDPSPANLTALQGVATQFVDQNSARIDQVCTVLTE